MKRYTYQQRLFIYATFVKTDSASETRKIFKQEFGGVSPPHASTIKYIVNRFRETGTFDDILTERRRVLTEETLDEIFSKVSNSPNKPLHVIAEEMGLKIQTLITAIKMLQTKYKVKIETKRKNVNQDRKRNGKVVKRRELIPVTVLSNLTKCMIDCGIVNSDDSVDEFVLPDDPLKITDSCTGNFEQVIIPPIKTEVKEEIVISDSDDEVIECADYSSKENIYDEQDLVVDENSLDDAACSSEFL